MHPFHERGQHEKRLGFGARSVIHETLSYPAGHVPGKRQDRKPALDRSWWVEGVKSVLAELRM